jgi:hypothetical protein
MTASTTAHTSGEVPTIQVTDNRDLSEPLGSQGFKTEAKREPRVKYKVVRKLDGILLSIGANEARVLFVQREGTIEYIIPYEPLKNARVTTPNQPFEYSEVIATYSDGKTQEFVEILAIAPASSATIKPLPLSDEFKEKRKRILKYFSKPE